MRPTFDEYFLGLAEAAAKRGDCRRRQVGAVLVQDDRIVSTGYNGTSKRGVPGCLDGACPRGLLSYEEQPEFLGYASSGCEAIHAEMNALLDAARRVPGILSRGAGDMTLYVSCQPCGQCAKAIEGVGVGRVVWPGSDEV